MPQATITAEQLRELQDSVDTLVSASRSLSAADEAFDQATALRNQAEADLAVTEDVFGQAKSVLDAAVERVRLAAAAAGGA